MMPHKTARHRRAAAAAKAAEVAFTSRQVDQSRSDFAGIADGLDFVKDQLARIPTRKEPRGADHLRRGGVGDRVDRVVLATRLNDLESCVAISTNAVLLLIGQCVEVRDQAPGADF